MTNITSTTTVAEAIAILKTEYGMSEKSEKYILDGEARETIITTNSMGRLISREPLRDYAAKLIEKAKNDEAVNEMNTAKKAAQTVITVSYADYKNNYNGYRTVKDSYDKKTKTIQVITSHHNTGLCPKCHTYCYGDCSAK